MIIRGASLSANISPGQAKAYPKSHLWPWTLQTLALVRKEKEAYRDATNQCTFGKVYPELNYRIAYGTQ